MIAIDLSVFRAADELETGANTDPDASSVDRDIVLDVEESEGVFLFNQEVQRLGDDLPLEFDG